MDCNSCLDSKKQCQNLNGSDTPTFDTIRPYVLCAFRRREMFIDEKVWFRDRLLSPPFFTINTVLEVTI